MSDMCDTSFCIECGESHCDNPHYTADNEGPFCEGCFEAYEIASGARGFDD